MWPWLYVWVFRGTPVYLQLLMWFNLALIFPVRRGPWSVHATRTIDLVTPFVAASIGLGLNQGAYTSEVVRVGILSVDEGQTEAAQAIGMTRLQIMRRIVCRRRCGSSSCRSATRSSACSRPPLASAIGVSEILSEAQHIYFVNNRIMELLIVCAVWYLGAVSLLSIGQFYLERFFAKGSSSKQLPLTPLQHRKKFFGTNRKAIR